jgi:hypothetical protein
VPLHLQVWQPIPRKQCIAELRCLPGRQIEPHDIRLFTTCVYSHGRSVCASRVTFPNARPGRVRPRCSEVNKRDRIEDWATVECDIRSALVGLTRLDFRFHRECERRG